MPLYIAFIDLMKAFDLVSRSGLIKVLEKVGCLTQLLTIIKQLHENMKGTVHFNEAKSEASQSAVDSSKVVYLHQHRFQYSSLYCSDTPSKIELMGNGYIPELMEDSSTVSASEPKPKRKKS